MQSEMEIVRAYYAAVEAGDMEKAGQFLSDDFTRYGTTPGSMGKREALALVHLLKKALPDLKYALSNIHSDGRTVTLTVQGGGRHLGPLDLADMGMGIEAGIVPSSGRMIIFLPELFEYTVINGKITAERNVTPATLFNGVNGFLHAMGVTE